jgi:hypothetical protein
MIAQVVVNPTTIRSRSRRPQSDCAPANKLEESLYLSPLYPYSIL